MVCCFCLRSCSRHKLILCSGVEETNGGLVVFGGGLPLYKNDYLIGGIGVSGGSVDQDVQVVQAAVDWFTNATLKAY